jgi:hypothetical protein
MQRLGQYIRWLLTEEPAIVSWVTGGGLTALLAFVFHWDRPHTAAAGVILASAATVWTAIWARPPEVALGTGALAAAFAAMGTFGFHPSAHFIALAGGALAAFMAFEHRAHLSPWMKLGKPVPAGPPAVPVRE